VRAIGDRQAGTNSSARHFLDSGTGNPSAAYGAISPTLKLGKLRRFVLKLCYYKNDGFKRSAGINFFNEIGRVEYNENTERTERKRPRPVAHSGGTKRA
jgi:hypothetical protein